MTGTVQPVFLFGVARSGTNLLARALDAHPATTVVRDPLMPLFRAWRNAVAARTAVATRFDPTAPFQDYYFDADGPVLLEAMLEADPGLPIEGLAGLREAVHERAALESGAHAAVFADWRGNTAAELFADALRLMASWSDGASAEADPVVAIKEVWTLEFARPLARAFPEARFLVIHRDPRAVLASLIELARRDPDQAAHTVSYMRHWRKHMAVSHRLAKDPALSGCIAAVRFEDLVARPESEMAAVYQFLNLPVSAVGAPRDRSAWPSNSSFADAGAGVDAGAAARWRTYLSPDVIAAVDYHCGPEMALLGYEPVDPSGDAADGVLRHVQEAHLRPGKWRSDSGDPAADMAWEARRREILDGRRADSDEIRRSFLFEDVFGALAEAAASTRKVS